MTIRFVESAKDARNQYILESSFYVSRTSTYALVNLAKTPMSAEFSNCVPASKLARFNKERNELTSCHDARVSGVMSSSVGSKDLRAGLKQLGEKKIALQW